MTSSATIVPSLDEVPATDLDRVAASARTYNSPAWWRAHERVPTSEITGGTVETRYLVVRESDNVTAIAPLLHVRDATEFFAYNLRRHYFEHFFDNAGDVGPRTRRLFGLARGYGRLLRGLGCPMNEMLLVTSPMAYGSGVAFAVDDRPARARALAAVAAAAREERRRLRRPVLLPFLPPNLETLCSAGFREVFQCYDNRIPLDGLGALDDYFATFPKSSRQNMRRETRRTADSGIVFEDVSDPAPIADRLTTMYEETSRQHTDRFPRFPAEYWVALKESLAGRLHLVVARRDDEVVGFHTLVECPATGDLCSHRVGRDYSGDLGKVPFYFAMCFYEPVRRAVESGFRGLRLGPGAENGKRRRHAQQIPQHGYVWFPRTVDRFLMGRYALRFGRLVQKTIADSCDVPLDVVPELEPHSAGPNSVDTKSE